MDPLGTHQYKEDSIEGIENAPRALIVPFGDPNPRLQAKDKVDEVALCDDIEWALTPSTT